MNCPLRPLGSRIVGVVEKETMTKSGLYTPNTYQKDVLEVEAVAVSEDIENIKVGDKVRVTSTQRIKIGDTEYHIVDVDNCIAIVNAQE